MFSLLANWTTDMWSPVINLFSFIPNYAWSIIVFTIILKLILSPLDFWQRKTQRDSMKKQQELQPYIEKLQKQYANNRQVLNQKTMELYKKHNYNVVGSCVSVLINFALTIFIFFTLFYGLTGMSQNKIYDQYNNLQTNFYKEYSTAYGIEDNKDAVWTHYQGMLGSKETEARDKLVEEGVAEPTAEQIYAKEQELVLQEETIQTILNNENKYYDTIKDSWLWVDSIWRPDTYVSGFPDYDAYKSASALTSRDEYKAIADDQTLTQEQKDAIFAQWKNEYNLITNKIQTSHSSWNGYFILTILAALITYLSISFSQRTSLKRNKQQAAAPQQNTMKIMKIIMPIIMVFFTLSYSAAFAIYIVTNQIMSFLLSIIALAIFSKKDGDNSNTVIVKPKKIDVEYSR